MSTRITATGTKRILGIDDSRELSFCSVLCRDYWSGVSALLNMGPWDEVHLDHDLGSYENGREYTGYDLISWLEEAVANGDTVLPGKIWCVSSNPSGRARIQQVIDKLYKEDKNEQY